MCEKINCPNKGKTLCRCAPLKEMAVEDLLRHVLNNITEIHPVLEYRTLTEQEPRTLRILGECRCCGGALCYCLNVEPLTGGKLLEHLYTSLRLFCDAAQEEMDRGRFCQLFLQMFHEGETEHLASWAYRHSSPELSGRKG